MCLTIASNGSMLPTGSRKTAGFSRSGCQSSGAINGHREPRGVANRRPAWHCGNGSAIRRKIRCVPHYGPCRGAHEADPLYHSDSESRRPETGGNQNGERPDFYRDGIASVVRRRQQSDLNLYFLNGLTLIDDPLFLLVTNNVHPNDAGMHRIAQGVAAALKPILAPVG